MTIQKLLTVAVRCGFWAGFLICGSPMMAQATFRTTTKGTEFTLERLGSKAEDVPGGRRFRGQAGATITFRGPLHLPASSAADLKLNRLIIRFRTSRAGGSLTGVELLSSLSNSVFYRHLGIEISGDYSTREVKTPPGLANVLDLQGLKIGSVGTTIRLSASFAAGFEGVADPGELVLLSVEAEFPTKIAITQGTTPRTGGATVPSHGTPSAPASPAPPTPAPGPAGKAQAAPGRTADILYALMPNNDLWWLRHDGMADGAFNLYSPPAQKVGNGWAVKHVFSAGSGVIYTVLPNNVLMWYRHMGIGDGSFNWSGGKGSQVGTGWGFKQVFAGGGGVIYAVSDSNELLWYLHTGYTDGSFAWASKDPKVVGNGWKFKQLFPGGGGVIYAINDQGELFWYRHDGRATGAYQWAAASGAKIGSGWNFKHAFSAGRGVIFAVNDKNEMLFYRHDGFEDGSPRWSPDSGKRVGVGWEVTDAFSGATLQP
ncbi:MAG: tachylectin-related carbohydrate-binding protein [Bryobacteraceae bacterium]